MGDLIGFLYRGHLDMYCAIHSYVLPYVVLMLARRHRRQANIKTTLGQRIMFSGKALILY